MSKNITDNIDSYQHFVRMKADYGVRARQMSQARGFTRKFVSMVQSLNHAAGQAAELLQVSTESTEPGRGPHSQAPEVLYPVIVMVKAIGELTQEVQRVDSMGGDYQALRERFKGPAGEVLRSLVSFLSELQIEASDVAASDFQKVLSGDF